MLRGLLDLLCLLLVTACTAAADSTPQSKIQDGTVEPELLPVSELPQALSQMSTTLLGGAPASEQVMSNSTRIGLNEVGKLTEANPGAKSTSLVSSLLASDANVGTLSSSEVEGTIKGKGKPKGSKGKRKQKQTAFGRKGKGQDGKLTVLDSLAAAKQDAAERGIFMKHEPVAAAEADASLLGSRATAAVEREVEQGLQQKSKHANAGHAGGRQSAQEHFPQLATRGEGMGSTMDVTTEQARRHKQYMRIESALCTGKASFGT